MKTTLLFLSVFLSANLFGQNVYIPDANFKAYLVGNPAINTNGDTEIQVSEANSFNGFIDCEEMGINDLTGIEAFISLTSLNCGNNSLSSLAFSQNTALINLECYENQLISLDVSQNTALTELACSGNQLTNLDLSNNTALIGIDCDNNQLTSIDVSQNTALQALSCAYNQLTNLDVSQNTALEWLICGLNQLTNLDLSNNIALIGFDCNDNQLTSLDVSQNTALEFLFCVENQLTCLNVANGNNTNANIMASNNPNLTCVQVDDAEWSTGNWTDFVDPQTSFSEDCNNDCTSSLTELSTSKHLIQILDMMGRETSFKANTPLIYVYDDGNIEKVFSVEY